MGQRGGGLHLTPLAAPCGGGGDGPKYGLHATCLLQFLCLGTVIHHVLAGLTAC